jgi:hypothetical protein
MVEFLKRNAKRACPKRASWIKVQLLNRLEGQIGAGLCAFGLVISSGCAMQEKKEAAAAQAMPVSCATAPGDLRVLNSEKASTASKIGNGISMVAPIGLVAGLVTGTEKTKYEVTTGEYNKALDTKIGQIKAACPGVQAD